jgi:hypothetical protein
MTALLKVLEDSPREQVPRKLVRLIRDGARYENLLAAVSVAAARNVQPYPDVGFKYHSVMVLGSIHTATAHLSDAERWLPIIWAADYFKDTQAQERATSGWRLPPRRSVAATPQLARRALTTALDNWDREAADAAIVQYLQVAEPDEIFAVLFPYGARDLRAIGHKAIAVSNAHRVIGVVGRAHAEPVLRSTVAALLNPEGDPDPAHHDLEADRPWRQNQQRLAQLTRSAPAQHASMARNEVRTALDRVSDADAGAAVIELLQRGVSQETIWQGLFDYAAELLMRAPSIVLVHAQTTANALHYAYRVCASEPTRQMLLLQAAAFVAMFSQMAGTAVPGSDLETLQPVAPHAQGREAVDEIFSDAVAGRRPQAIRKSLGYLRGGGDAAQLIAAVRHHLVYNAEEAHQYKFTEAVLDSYAQMPDPAWRNRFLSAGMAFFTAPAKHPRPLISEALELLQS